MSHPQVKDQNGYTRCDRRRLRRRLRSLRRPIPPHLRPCTNGKIPKADRWYRLCLPGEPEVDNASGPVPNLKIKKGGVVFVDAGTHPDDQHPLGFVVKREGSSLWEARVPSQGHKEHSKLVSTGHKLRREAAAALWR